MDRNQPSLLDALWSNSENHQEQQQDLATIVEELAAEVSHHRLVEITPSQHTIHLPLIEMIEKIGQSHQSPLITDTKEENKDEWIEVHNSSLYHHLRENLSKKKFVHNVDEHWPTADLTTENQKMQAVAQLRPIQTDKKSFFDEEQLEALKQRMSKHVLEMDDVTADVLDMISALWLRQAPHYDALVTITADDLLKLRGIKQQKSGTGRRGGFKDEFRQDIAKHIDILGDTWIKVFEMEVTLEEQSKKGKQQKRELWQGESRAIVVTSRAGMVNSEGHINPYVWRVRPGDVFAQFIFGPGRQTALLSLKALEYDPYRYKWEKRLTRYLAWQWRNRQKNGNYLQPISVQKLLKTIEEFDERNPARTKQRLEKALDQLHEDAIIAGWQYETCNEDIVGQKGWAQDWLKWKLIIEPPEEIMDQYSKIQTPETSKDTAALSKISGELIKQIRLSHGLNQMKAAEEIDISQATLSRIEKGKQPDLETMKKLMAWIQHNS